MRPQASCDKLLREGARELLICTGKAEVGGVLVAVRDSGPGLAPGTLEHVFETQTAHGD
jgi:C4-dicarboxylate-specific signal transduction histidine kinase